MVLSSVVWHDLECGLYGADLALWHELAAACPEGPILDVGAGTGRVTLELARGGRQLIALDHDPELLAALRQRAGDLAVETFCADARSFALPQQGQVALCIAPMQTVQLLGGREGRLAFLRCAKAHLREGGLLACALVTELEPFDCREGGEAPSAETASIDGLRYSSQATRVELAAASIAIERRRRVSSGPTSRERSGAVERDLIELDRVSAEELEREGVEVGLGVEPARLVAATEEHTGSTVVVLRA